MSVEWFTKRPGENIAVGSDDPHMALIGVGVPDWVQLPAELGGARVRVVSAAVTRCPRGEHDVRHLKLDNGIGVAECPAHGGFLWYRPRGA